MAPRRRPAAVRSSAPTALVVSRPRARRGRDDRARPPTVVWDSGRVASAEQAFVAYRGPALASRHRRTAGPSSRGRPRAPRARWRPTPPSRPGLADHDWKAKWIGRSFPHGPGPDDYTYARHEFVLASSSDRARPRLCVGRPAVRAVRERHPRRKGAGVQLPGLAVLRDAGCRRRCSRPGATNAVGIVSSWQGADQGPPRRQAGRDRPDLGPARRWTPRARRHRRFVAGPSWERGSPGTQRDLEGDLVDFTENVDGPAEPVGWQEPGFDDRLLGARHGARSRPVWRRGDTWSRCAPASWRNRCRRVTLTRLASGAVVADFGKVYAAVPTVSFHHGRGREARHHAGRLSARRARPRPALHRRAGPGVDHPRHPAHRHELQLRPARRRRGVPSFRLSRLPLLPDRRPRRDPDARPTSWR